jgi:hypothetical protein
MLTDQWCRVSPQMLAIAGGYLGEKMKKDSRESRWLLNIWGLSSENVSVTK